MNRQQAKELLPIMQAFAEGKTIQFKNAFGNWINCDGVLFNYPPKDYRIKSEPKYRPFKDAEECWQEMLKHQPFGWLKSSENNRFIISAIRNEGICINGAQYYSYYDSVFNKYPFADDTPFGIKE
nr:MAG TPA: hypothetical protein [Crassvirales sp.]